MVRAGARAGAFGPPPARAVAAVLAAFLALAAAGVTRAAGAAGGLLLVTYTTSTSLQVTLGDGTAVRAGSVVPAGVYNVQVKNDPNSGDPSPAFIVSGPGVNVSSDLNSTGMGLDGLSVFGPITLQTSSSYRIGDSGLPSSVVTFTTSATDSSTSTSGGSGGSVTSTPAGGTAATPSTALAGTLRASVSSSGKAALVLAGKAVKSVKAGRYSLVVTNRAHGVAFMLWRGSRTVVSIAHGQKTVALTAGRWFFAASAHGPRTAFTVVG